ncbi:MAG: hypothetical protein KR126chlam3_01611 [Chlamydiae bacterium]|nr:hypothetical protein [Chlamydiota bacterium]
MKIYLVRHGQAVSPEVDPEKPLSPQGRENIEMIAKFLGKKSFPLSLILHSQKLRAKQTAEIMGQYIAPGLALEEHAQMAPNDPIEAGFSRTTAEDGDTMIVGHLPYLQKLLSYMIVDNEDLDLVQFNGGTTICVESFNGSWIIDWIVCLELL